MLRFNRRTRNNGKRGVAAVEYAVVLSVALLMVWIMVEYSRMMMACDCLLQAAQEGARIGVVPGSTTAQVTAEVNNILANSFITGATVTTSPADISTLKAGQTVTVNISVPCNSITWLPSPKFLYGRVLKGSCVMLREAK
jgi:Flp pilus assembly protein TadG